MTRIGALRLQEWFGSMVAELRQWQVECRKISHRVPAVTRTSLTITYPCHRPEMMKLETRRRLATDIPATAKKFRFRRALPSRIKYFEAQ